MNRLLILTIAASLLGGRAGLVAAEAEPEAAPAMRRFAEQIRPVLAERCWKCHGPQQSKSGLRLDSRAGLLQGGDSGPAIVPGQPEGSLLIAALRHDGDIQMPPKEKLPNAVVAEFAAWVRDGAPWAESAGETAETTHWSLRPIGAPSPPAESSGWAGTEIDRFLRAKQREQGLDPAADADPRTLIRRVTFDLVGLPPTPEEVDDFVQACAPSGPGTAAGNQPAVGFAAAYAALIERLLASPRYGEHWGRHWLDVVRYADSGGFETDARYPNAWQYRDYVIRAFHEDMPLDRFIQQQIAGDELWPDDPQALIATALYCVGPVQEDSAMVEMQLENEWLTDAVDTTGAAFLGITLGCARCHNHKYDPVSQREYYSLQAVFAASDRPYSREIRERRLKALNGVLAEVSLPKQFAADPRCKLYSEDKVGFHLFHRDAPLAIHRLHRGEPNKPREPTPPGFPAALGPAAGELAADPAQRRAALARWSTAPDHPLTARVLVNRVWGWHFGQPLVATPNDFGKQGEPPTHPDLLDWLANDLMAHGWSLKRLQRQILLSHAYRLTSVAEGPGMERDPRNRLLWHFPRRRLEAEAIRDSMLACAGTLNPKAGGPPVVPPLSPEELTGLFQSGSKWKVTADPAEHARRSVYVLARRTFTLPVLAMFDSRETMASCPRRATTTAPTQALALLNGSLAREQAEALSKRVLAEAAGQQAIERLWRLVFGRSPTPDEVLRAQALVGDRGEAGWIDLCLALFNTNEFVFVD